MQNVIHAATTQAPVLAPRSTDPQHSRLLDRVDPGRPYFGQSATAAQIAAARAGLDSEPARYLPL